MKNENKKKKFKHKSPWLHDFVKITGAIPCLLWFRPKTVYMGKEKKFKLKGGAIITANHSAFTDPILMFCAFWYRRLHLLATKDLYFNKLSSWFFNRVLCIKVDKENFSLNSFHEICTLLEADKAIMMFPEGQVNRTNEMMNFKSGAVLMAHKSNKPIVPTAIIKPDKWYKRHVVVIGEPVNVRELCGPTPSLLRMQEVSEMLRQKEIQLIEQYNNLNKKTD